MTTRARIFPLFLPLTALLALGLAGCGSPEPASESGPAPEASTPGTSPGAPDPSEQPPSEQPAEATDLFGEPLHRPVLPDDFRVEQEVLLAEALAAREADPESLDAWVWVGRRQAYLGRYNDAIATYTEALEKLGEAPELYRHRGHRYLTIRRWQLAEADLERAAELIEGRPDEVEQDGLPNAAGIPTSTLGTNSWYHLGLARYLQGDFEGARLAYEQCMALSKNDDMKVATAYWHYLSLRRLAMDGDASAVLESIHADMEILENDAYHQLLLLYRASEEGAGGDREGLLAAAREEGEAALATTGYGVAMDAYFGDDTTRPLEIWREIVDTGAWASFGCLAAEAELKRME